MFLFQTFKVLVKWTQYEICHLAWSSELSCKLSRQYDQPFSRKWRLKLLFFGKFSVIPELKLSLPFWVMEGRMWRCKYLRLAELPLLYFCKRKTRGETQFWIELAASYTLANNNIIHSDETLPYAMARIASGVDACCYRHVPYDVINKRLSASFAR